MADATFTQDNREFQLTTSLGKDVLLFRRMVGRDAMNTLFEYEVDAYSTMDATIDMNALLGQSATVSVDYGDDGDTRYFNGIVARCRFNGTEDGFKCYRLTLRPSLWLLTRSSDSRIFMDQSVVDIVKAVLGQIPLQLSVQATYDQYNYCVQYRETDFNFFSRLVEQEGIAYYFTHTDGAHKLVLTDNLNGYAAGDALLYWNDSGETPETDYVNDWSIAREIQAKTIELQDYHFGMPSSALQSTRNNPTPSIPTRTIYDYPGGYAASYDPVDKGGGDTSSNLQKISTLGDKYARIRADEAQGNFACITASGNVRALFSGLTYQFDNDGDLPADWTNNYKSLITACHHVLTGDNYRGSGNGAEASYQVNYTAMPIAGDGKPTTYVPPRITPKPMVPGPQTAIVVGPSSGSTEEIFVDKFGRVKVQFFWDRINKKNSDSSCWVRVAQVWAGKQWGGIIIPRVGHEVIVDFIEGDPDQPIITGRVYNADNMPPYTLPDNKTQTGLKSRSSLGGGTDDYNELRFEDKKGSEEVHIQAQKDMNTVIKNSATVTIGSSTSSTCPEGSLTTSIYKDETLSIETGNRTHTIKKGNDTLTISEGNRDETISKGNDSLTISEGNRTTSISVGTETVSIKGDRSTTISSGNETLKVNEGNRATTIGQGNESLTVSQGNRTTTISQGNDSLAIQAGNLSIKLDAGSCSIEAMQSIELKVGGSSIKIDMTGVTIQGTGTVTIGGPQTTVKGDATLTLTGGMTMINS